MMIGFLANDIKSDEFCWGPELVEKEKVSIENFEKNGLQIGKDLLKNNSKYENFTSEELVVALRAAKVLDDKKVLEELELLRKKMIEEKEETFSRQLNYANQGAHSYHPWFVAMAAELELLKKYEHVSFEIMNEASKQFLFESLARYSRTLELTDNFLSKIKEKKQIKSTGIEEYKEEVNRLNKIINLIKEDLQVCFPGYEKEYEEFRYNYNLLNANRDEKSIIYLNLYPYLKDRHFLDKNTTVGAWKIFVYGPRGDDQKIH